MLSFFHACSGLSAENNAKICQVETWRKNYFQLSLLMLVPSAKTSSTAFLRSPSIS